MKSLETFGPLIAASLVVMLCLLLGGLTPPGLEWRLLSYVPVIFALLWITEDARRRRCTPCFDFGLLMWYLFPLTLLGYLVWTRGWWGLVVFVGVLAVIYVPWMLGTALAIMAAG
ncbi:MAG TPA: hypothetical protein VMP01_13325 [Pirellulaceae bacterium]|nr:hypothetical protein [Pirellulaceae bacterium]